MAWWTAPSATTPTQHAGTGRAGAVRPRAGTRGAGDTALPLSGPAGSAHTARPRGCGRSQRLVPRRPRRNSRSVDARCAYGARDREEAREHKRSRPVLVSVPNGQDDVGDAKHHTGDEEPVAGERSVDHPPRGHHVPPVLSAVPGKRSARKVLPDPGRRSLLPPFARRAVSHTDLGAAAREAGSHPEGERSELVVRRGRGSLPCLLDNSSGPAAQRGPRPTRPTSRALRPERAEPPGQRDAGSLSGGEPSA